MATRNRRFVLSELQERHPEYAPIIRYIKLLERQLDLLHTCDEPYCDCAEPELFRLEAWKEAWENANEPLDQRKLILFELKDIVGDEDG